MKIKEIYVARKFPTGAKFEMMTFGYTVEIDEGVENRLEVLNKLNKELEYYGKNYDSIMKKNGSEGEVLSNKITVTDLRQEAGKMELVDRDTPFENVETSILEVFPENYKKMLKAKVVDDGYEITPKVFMKDKRDWKEINDIVRELGGIYVREPENKKYYWHLPKHE